MKKLALFDMDGTLFDTAEVNYLAYKEAAAKLGIDIPRDKFMEVYEGRNYKDFMPLFGVMGEQDLQFVHEEKKKIYPQYIGKAKVNWFLTDLLEELPDYYDKALVTTASRKNVLDILSAFGLENAFDFMITQEDAAKLKPDPEAFLMAMEKAGATPENTIIFEDSQVGIEAAYATGAAVMQVRRF